MYSLILNKGRIISVYSIVCKMFYSAIFNILYFIEIFHNLINLSLVRLDPVVNLQYVSWYKMDASYLAIAFFHLPAVRGKKRMTHLFFIRT